jgi:tetratricopeptide (TPR) repeat protein
MKTIITLIIAAIISFNCFSQESDKAIEKALKYIEDYELEKAEQVLSRLLSKEPGNTTALKTRGEIREKLDNVSGAWQDYASAVSYDPGNSELTIALIEYTAYKKLYNDLISFSSKAISSKPGYANLYYLRGHSYYAIQNFQNAINDLSKALDLKVSDGLKALVYSIRGTAFYETGKSREAIRDLRKSFEESSLRTDKNYMILGYSYLSVNNPDSAIIAFTESFELLEKMSIYYKIRRSSNVGIAIGYCMKKDYTTALKYINELVCFNIDDIKKEVEINDPKFIQSLTEMFIAKDDMEKEARIKACVSGDCKNGFGILEYPDGRYEGYWKDGKFEGKGIMVLKSGYRYDGEWKNGERNGFGTTIYTNGEKYVGSMVNDRIQGKGTVYNSDGTIKRNGTWNDAGLFNGYGTETYSNGRYEGNWANGKENGEGSFYFDNGDKYSGSFVNGDCNGQGTYYLKSGDRRTGTWGNWKMNGQGAYYYINGDKFTGTFIDSKLYGTGTFTDKEGNNYPCIEANGVINVNRGNEPVYQNAQPVYQFSQPASPNQITVPATFSPGLR